MGRGQYAQSVIPSAIQRATLEYEAQVVRIHLQFLIVSGTDQFAMIDFHRPLTPFPGDIAEAGKRSVRSCGKVRPGAGKSIRNICLIKARALGIDGDGEILVEALDSIRMTRLEQV